MNLRRHRVTVPGVTRRSAATCLFGIAAQRGQQRLGNLSHGHDQGRPVSWACRRLRLPRPQLLTSILASD